MVSERRDVAHPIWRKKMDSSMFDHKMTFIPHWVIDNVFKIREVYPHSSKKDPRSIIVIEYRHKNGRETKHYGWVTTTRYSKGRNDITRLFIDNDVCKYLEIDFVMTYHRAQEKKFRECNSITIEREIPFWEFLDIEYNYKDGIFIFTPHYTQVKFGMDRFSYLQN